MFDPWWPLAALAAVQLVDAALSWQPVGFVRDCLTDVRFPRRYWKLLTPLKLAAATGLVVGIWLPPLAFLTCAALVSYFVVAIAMHVAAHDLGPHLWINAAGMLVLSTAVLVTVVTAERPLH